MSKRTICRYLLLFVAAIALLGCTRNKHIMRNIHEDMIKNKKRTIDLADYTDFKWDKAYIFAMPINHEPLPFKDEVGFDCTEVFHRRGDGDEIWPIIFVRSGKIIYQEDLEYPVYIRAEKDSVTQCFIEVKRKQSKFKVEVRGKGEIVFYAKNKRMVNSGSESSVNVSADSTQVRLSTSIILPPKSDIDSITSLVKRFTDNIFREKDYNYNNGFQHLLWQAAITCKYGKDIAKQIGDLHEAYPDFDTSYRRFEGEARSEYSDVVKDLLNNEIGRAIGLRCVQMRIDEIAFQILRHMYEKGFYLVRYENNGKCHVIEYHKITYSLYFRCFERLEELDKNGSIK